MEDELKDTATNTEETPEVSTEETAATESEELNPNSELEALRAENEQLKKHLDEAVKFIEEALEYEPLSNANKSQKVLQTINGGENENKRV